MAQYNQVGGFDTGNNAYVLGTTSRRELLFFSGDNISIPPLRGRANFDIVAGGTIGLCGNVLNPTTETLLVEKVILYVETPSSAASALSLGVSAAAATSSASIADATLASDTGGYIMLNSSNVFPLAWATATYITAYQALGSTTLVGSFSVFYTCGVTT